MWGLEIINTLEFTQKSLDLSHNIAEKQGFSTKDLQHKVAAYVQKCIFT